MPRKEYDFAEKHAKALEEFGDREVTLGGETLLFKVNVPYGVFIELDELREADALSTFSRAEEIIFSLVDGDEETLARARANLRSTLTAEDLIELLNTLIEDNSGRPTSAPESSENGRTPTGTSSTDISSSPPAEDSPA